MSHPAGFEPLHIHNQSLESFLHLVPVVSSVFTVVNLAETLWKEQIPRSEDRDDADRRTKLSCYRIFSGVLSGASLVGLVALQIVAFTNPLWHVAFAANLGLIAFNFAEWTEYYSQELNYDW